MNDFPSSMFEGWGNLNAKDFSKDLTGAFNKPMKGDTVEESIRKMQVMIEEKK